MSDIEHICLADDGKLKAVYSDSDVIVLSPRGGMFAYISGQDVVRQHCAFVVSKWSASKEAAEAAECLQTVSDGRISLKSEDETARLVLHPHGRRFAVCFPLLIGKTQDENSALTYHYVWQTQVFATADFPERWEYPLKLALNVVQTSSGQEAAQTVEEGGKQEKDKSAAGEPSSKELDLGQTTGDIIQQVTAIMIGPYASTSKDQEQENQQEEGSEAQEQDIIQRTTHLPQASQPAFEDPKFLEEQSWWTDPTGQQAPTKEVIQVKWTPDLFMQFVPSLREVHAWLTRDESFVATSDKGTFVKHQTAPKFESLYRSNALPVHAWSADGSGRYDFQPLGQAVLQLRQQSMDMLERRAVEADSAAAAAARVQQPVKSSEIKAKQTVRDLGVFTAFEDGRIRVRFADRTIVAVDRWHRFVEVVHRDGTTGTVSVTAPHGATEYVKAAMEFGNWVFKTDEQKDLARAAKRAVDATANANQRMALLCEYAVTDRVPEAVASASEREQHAEYSVPQTSGGPGEIMQGAASGGVQGGARMGSPAGVATSHVGLSATGEQVASLGARSSLAGLGSVSGAGAGRPPASGLDFAAAGQFGIGGGVRVAGVPSGSVLRTPALKGSMHSQHTQRTGVPASIPGPLVPDPPTVLPAAPNFGVGGRGMWADHGGLDAGGGAVGGSLSFRHSAESFPRASLSNAEDRGEYVASLREASEQHAMPGDMPSTSAGGALGAGPYAHMPPGTRSLGGRNSLRGPGVAPSFNGAEPTIHTEYGTSSASFTPLRGGGQGLSGVTGVHRRPALSGNFLSARGVYVPGGSSGRSGAVPVSYASRVEELEAEFASTKENLEVPGPSFAGDREDVVEKWLKRNQQILAGLDL